MLALFLASILATVPALPPDDLDACLEQSPAQNPPPITWRGDLSEIWTARPPVPLDSVRAALTEVRAARRCFRDLSPSAVDRPYLGNILRTYHAETALLAALRRFPEAFETFEKAYSYLASEPPIPDRDGVDSSWLFSLHQNHGFLHYLLGDLSSAIDQYLRALRATPPEKIDDRITLLLDVGALHQRTQDYQAARYYYDRADRLSQKNGLRSDPLRGRLFLTKADFLLEKTLNTDLQWSLLERARDLARQSRSVTPPGTERHASASLTLSESLGYLGAFGRAYQLNQEARRYARDADDSRFHAFALLKLGVLHMQTERWANSESVLKGALSTAERLGDLDYQRRIFRALGRLHELQNDWSTAEEHYRRGIAVIETYRESLTATQWSSTAFAQWRDVHRGLVRTLMAQERPRDALTALDQTRARHLQDLRTQSRVANELPPSTRARLDSLTRTLTDVRTRIGTDTLSNAAEADLRDREATLMTARQQILRRDTSVTDRPSLGPIVASLGWQDRALVSYFLDDPWPVYDRSPRSAAFLLAEDTLRIVSLPELTQDSVQAQVTDISPLFAQTGEPAHVNAMHFDLRPLRTLHDHLYAPIAEYLPDGQPLTVIPDGPMFHVPFSMLASATSGGRYDHTQARFLLHERPTTLDLSTSMAADTSASSFDPDTFTPTLAAFGVSTFDTLRAVPSALRATLPEDAADSSLALSPLPGVKAEMNALTQLFGDAKTFLDDTATESRFREACRRAGVLHLASHAFVHPSSPLQNAFLLRPDSASDGVLFLHELRTQDRIIPLAVLSGCGTARGTLRGGEGMAGLQYAFQAMGAQSTVSNLWPTADQPSVELMEAFYKNLRAGLPKDRALRQAKLAHLESNPDKASPFFWGSSVLYGSPRPMPMQEHDTGSFWSWTFLALAGLAVLLVVLLSRFIPLPRSFRRLISS
jgi:CHAT domain-containing protein